MLSIKNNNNTTNQKLIQFKIALKKNGSSEKNSEWIFKKLGDVNMKVTATKYINMHCPHFIGSTALHLAYDYACQSRLSLVMSQRPNFTIKNKDNFTILHLILRHNNSKSYIFSKLRSTLKSRCINIILSAHLETRNPTNPCDGHGMSHFHIACMANHVEAVEFFLDHNIFVDHAINADSPYFAGFTPLHLAIRCCCLQVTKLLLKHGASISLKNAKGETALHMVMDNYLRFAEDFLLGYFDDSDQWKKSTNEEVAQILMKMVCSNDAMVIDESGLTCLHLACTMIDSSIAEKLLMKGDINHSIKMESPLWSGYTALHFAAHVNVNTVKMLVERGADLKAEDTNGLTPLDLCLRTYKIDFDVHAILASSSIYKNIKLTREISLLNLILAMRDYEKFRTFLDRHKNSAIIELPSDAPLWASFTPLHILVLFSSMGNSYICHGREESDGYKGPYLTLEKVLDVDNQIYYYDTVNHKVLSVKKEYLWMMIELHDRNTSTLSARDTRGRTPLHLSFRLSKMVYVVDLLLQLLDRVSFPSDIVDDEGLSLLHIACTRDNKNLVEKLLLSSKNVGVAYKGKSISDLMETGWTPLHVAVANDRVDIVELLLKCGADVHSQDAHGVTPIHLLVLRGRKKMEFLLSVPDFKECVVQDVGLSHLHAACFLGNADAAKILVDSGSNVNSSITRDRKVAGKSFELSKLVDYLGYTPLQMNVTNGIQFSTSDLLIQRGADIFVRDSKGMPYVLEYLNIFVAELKKNENLQKQVEDKIGLTNVHVACYSGDSKWLRDIVQDRANVNAKLSVDLPKCAGFTPLHIVVGDGYDFRGPKNKIELVKILLEAGADVSLSDAKRRTPLHMVHDYCYGEDEILVVTMLKAQKDFSVNPTNDQGISHFHIACKLSEIVVVKKFLERGNLDVNQPTDFFNTTSKHCVAGFTPLHMAAISDTISSQLSTVDLLLKHGADPNRQSSRGNTALHVTKRYEIFERISRSSTDMNVTNAEGHTPLGFLLSELYYPFITVVISADQVLNWLRCGCYYNAFNIFTGEGYIRKTIGLIPFNELKNLIEIAVINVPNAMRVDEMGRTAIHNVVTDDHRKKSISIIQYASLIDTLASTGCNVDSQDNLGRTPLHLAVEFRNKEAITALLMAGADVNICDKNGKAVLEYHSLCCKRWKGCDEDNSKWCDEFEILAFHVRKLQICQLELCHTNRSYVTDKFVFTMDDERFQIQLKEIQNMKIEPYRLTLGNLLSETNAVADYPTMSQPRKDAIDEFFSDDKISNFRDKFDEVAGLLSLQYRKSVMRVPLIEEAVTTLNFLANFPVPQICSRIIFGFLSNTDLKTFIASTKDYKGNGKGYKMDVPGGSLLEHKKLRIE